MKHAEKGVSTTLEQLIKKLMEAPELKDFCLGGGTNLALKYNHRISIDIDLFSSHIVGKNAMHTIIRYFEREFGKNNLIVERHNFESDQFAWATLQLIPENHVKIDLIQNIRLLHPLQTKDTIRLINDMDIGALKLLSAADRSVQKDFYDLYLLSELRPLSLYYDALQERKALDRKEDKSIFDIETQKPTDRLTTDLSALGNFNRAGNRKLEPNRVILTENSPVNMPWAILREKWKIKVRKLAQERGLVFKETVVNRTYNKKHGRGYRS